LTQFSLLTLELRTFSPSNQMLNLFDILNAFHDSFLGNVDLCKILKCSHEIDLKL